jgi:hypothetical protein
MDIGVFPNEVEFSIEEFVDALEKHYEYSCLKDGVHFTVTYSHDTIFTLSFSARLNGNSVGVYRDYTIPDLTLESIYDLQGAIQLDCKMTQTMIKAK